jgi:hypothetical protein
MTPRWRTLLYAVRACCRSPRPTLPARGWSPPRPLPWWESLALPYGTITILTAQAAEYDAALERYVSAVLIDIAEQGWRRTPSAPDHAGTVVPLIARPPRLPPAG